MHPASVANAPCVRHIEGVMASHPMKASHSARAVAGEELAYSAFAVVALASPKVGDWMAGVCKEWEGHLTTIFYIMTYCLNGSKFIGMYQHTIIHGMNASKYMGIN